MRNGWDRLYSQPLRERLKARRIRGEQMRRRSHFLSRRRRLFSRCRGFFTRSGLSFRALARSAKPLDELRHRAAMRLCRTANRVIRQP